MGGAEFFMSYQQCKRTKCIGLWLAELIGLIGS